MKFMLHHGRQVVRPTWIVKERSDRLKKLKTMVRRNKTQVHQSVSPNDIRLLQERSSIS